MYDKHIEEIGMITLITSIQNQQVKAWKKLKQRKYRKQTGTFIVEGFHLVEEAYNSNWNIETILIQENVVHPEWADKLSITTLSANVFKEIAATKTPQGIAAVVNVKESVMLTTGTTLLLDAVQDPGNVGTMIRTADALGFSQVVLGKGCADLFNEKVVRASQGSIFHLPVIEADLENILSILQKEKYIIWASTLEQAIPLTEATFTHHTALIVGNEGEGVSRELLELADKKVKIPIAGQAESFNVAVAAGIMMYAIYNS